jgi:hypothetical protein
MEGCRRVSGHSTTDRTNGGSIAKRDCLLSWFRTSPNVRLIGGGGIRQLPVNGAPDSKKHRRRGSSDHFPARDLTMARLPADDERYSRRRVAEES